MPDAATTGQDSEVDEAALRELLDDVRCGHRATPTTPSPACAACPSPTSASPASTTTGALRQGLAEAVYGPGKTPDAVRGHRRPSCSPPAHGPVLLTRADDEQAAAALAANPGPVTASAGTTVVWRPARRERPERVVRGHRRHRRPARGRRVRRRARAPTASGRLRITDVGVAGLHRLLAARRRARPPPTRSSWSPAWRARWPASSAGSPRRRSSPCPPAPATAPRSRASPRCWRCWRRARRASPSSASTTASARRAPCCGSRRRATDRAAVDAARDHRRLVPLLLAASPATWPSARWSTPAPTSTRCARCASALPVGGWELEAEAGACAAASAATKVHVHAEPTAPSCAPRPTSTAWSRRPACPSGCAGGRSATFDALAGAEGRLHRRPPEQVHFHEVGGIDAIVDVVGTCAALEVLGIDEVRSSPVANGIGMVRSRPRPAAQPGAGRGRAAAGARRPTASTSRGAHHADRRRAAGRPRHRLGADAGHDHRRHRLRRRHRDLDGAPNLTQVVIGDRSADQRSPPGQPVVLLEVNVDDATGETLAHTDRRAARRRRPRRLDHADRHEEGPPGLHGQRAGRPVPAPGRSAACSRAETGSLGVRGQTLERWPAAAAPGRGRGRRRAHPGEGQRRAGQGRARRRGARPPASSGCRCASVSGGGGVASRGRDGSTPPGGAVPRDDDAG